jgi:hypothetical protein
MGEGGDHAGAAAACEAGPGVGGRHGVGAGDAWPGVVGQRAVRCRSPQQVGAKVLLAWARCPPPPAQAVLRVLRRPDGLVHLQSAIAARGPAGAQTERAAASAATTRRWRPAPRHVVMKSTSVGSTWIAGDSPPTGLLSAGGRRRQPRWRPAPPSRRIGAPAGQRRRRRGHETPLGQTVNGRG